LDGNGSSDGSAAIAQDYTACFPDQIGYIDYPDHRNLGICASRNLKLPRSRGDWIARLPASDARVPTKLAGPVDIVTRHPGIGLFVGASRYWYSWTGFPDDTDKDEINSGGVAAYRVYAPGERPGMLYRPESAIASSVNVVLVRADVLNRIGGWENRFGAAFKEALLVNLSLETSVYVSSGVWDPDRQWPVSVPRLTLDESNVYSVRRCLLEWLEGSLHSRRLEGSSSRPLMERSLRPHGAAQLARSARRRSVGS
jgi:glycosyltransferase involved in cell wall biosynthesis